MQRPAVSERSSRGVSWTKTMGSDDVGSKLTLTKNFFCSSKAALVKAIPQRPELVLFVVVVAVLNAPLLAGSCSNPLIFATAAVRAGEWWRLFTHPFVHVSCYHLIWDASAFFMLYC